MWRNQFLDRRAWILAVVVTVSASWISLDAAEHVRLADLSNRIVDPFQAPVDAIAIVFVFLSVDCPISNRYAPEIRRLYDTFAGQGVLFWLVYPNPAESAEAIRNHLKTFSYPARALRDPEQALVKIAMATITPEAAVFDGERVLVYRGRIDDRYVELGRERPAPTTHDLEEALKATLARQPVPRATTQAVGCYIADSPH